MSRKNLYFLILCLAFTLSGCGQAESNQSVAPTDETATERVKPADFDPTDMPADAEDKIASFLNELFAEGNAPAEVMEIGLPKILNEKAQLITQRMQESIAANVEWYEDAIRSVGEGEPLPYDEKLGITEEEYDFFKRLNEYMKLIKLKDITLQIRNNGATIDYANDESQVLKKFSIDIAKNTIGTELGEFKYDNEIVASDSQKVTGRWNGHTWRFVKGMSQSFQISIGRMEDGSKNIIYIKLLEVGQERKEEIILF